MASTINAKNTSTGVVITPDSSGQLELQTADTTRMTIDASGNVGIGTSSPSYKLDVATIAVAVSQAGGVRFGANDQYSLRLNQYTTAGGVPYAHILAPKDVNGYLAFSSGASDTERMRIDGSGNVLVGTTSAQNSAKISLAITSANNGMSIVQTDNATQNDKLLFVNTNGVVGYIRTLNSATTYSTSSDYRLKENIAPMTGALDTVAKLNPVTYTWKVDGSDGQGFIAHELQAVVPDCVTGEKDAVDADGNPVYQGVDTSFLVATLTKAIQELKAELDTVKAELAELKGTTN